MADDGKQAEGTHDSTQNAGQKPGEAGKAPAEPARQPQDTSTIKPGTPAPQKGGPDGGSKQG